MNQTFDLSRFNNYFTYFLKTGIRRHAAILGALLGGTLLIVIVPALMFGAFEYQYEGKPYNLFSGGEDPMWDTEHATFMLMLIVIMIISASTMFSDFGNKASRLDALMLPASALEKYLTRWIVFVPLTALVCFVGFELIDVVRCFLMTLKYGSGAPVHLIGLGMFSDNTFYELLPMLWLNLFIAVFALGAIVWPRLSCVKTFGAVCLIFIFYTWWTVFLHPMIQVGYVDPDIWQIVVDVVLLLVTLVIYVIAYYRLKEIELVQRW